MEDHYVALRSYVKSLSKKKLQEQLFEALAELKERGADFTVSHSAKNTSHGETHFPIRRCVLP